MNIKPGDVIKINSSNVSTHFYEFTITSIEYIDECDDCFYKLNLLNSNYYCILYSNDPLLVLRSTFSPGYLIFGNGCSYEGSLDKVTINEIPITEFLNGD